MEEKTFLNEGGVTVTSSRFIVPEQTYAMSGITSVKNSTDYPKRTGPILVGLVGVWMLALANWYGAIPIVLCILWWISQKPTFHILLATSGGELKALSSGDAAFISRVVKSLSDAIVHRG